MGLIHHSNQSQLVYLKDLSPVLGLLLFLVYINDLHKCVKYSKVYHFAPEDTNMLQSDNSLKMDEFWS